MCWSWRWFCVRKGIKRKAGLRLARVDDGQNSLWGRKPPDIRSGCCCCNNFRDNYRFYGTGKRYRQTLLTLRFRVQSRSDRQSERTSAGCILLWKEQSLCLPTRRDGGRQWPTGLTPQRKSFSKSDQESIRNELGTSGYSLGSSESVFPVRVRRCAGQSHRPFRRFPSHLFRRKLFSRKEKTFSYSAAIFFCTKSTACQKFLTR